jgi:hypothetical protein
MDQSSVVEAGTVKPDETSDAARVRAVFYIAHQPHGAIPVEFQSLTVDGISMGHVRPAPLPASQGWEVPLGNFEQGRSIELEWLFVTGDLGSPVPAKLGVYFASLLNRTVLAEVVLDTFTRYPGKATVKIK